MKRTEEKTEPRYLSICRQLEREIKTGKLQEGERLKAERILAQELHVARNTVKQAYELLCVKGLAYCIRGSGTYVRNRERQNGRPSLEIVEKAIKKLQEQGMGRAEIERLFEKTAWDTMPEYEKIHLAWIDCSEELIHNTAKEIADYCNVRVSPILLDDMKKDGNLLEKQEYDLYATTINHYEELLQSVGQFWERPEEKTEMVVLSVDTSTIARIAKLKEGERVIVVFGGQWYRYSVECFLEEFGAKGEVEFLFIDRALEKLEKIQKEIGCVILPQDAGYKDNYVKKISEWCKAKKIDSFPFIQVVDEGSMLHLRKKAYEIWKV